VNRRLRKTLNLLPAALLASVALTPEHRAHADDTDIYLNANVSGSAPYLMLSMDYRPDLSATFCSAKGGGACTQVLADHPELLAAVQSVAGEGNNASNMQAMIAVMQVVFSKFEGIHVGLMIPNNDDGGTLLRGYKLFEKNDTNGSKKELIEILRSIPIPNTGSAYHDTAPKEMHYEWYSYINGLKVRNGRNTERNFGGTSTPDYDSSIISGANYLSPFTANPNNFECTNFYEVYATSGNNSGADDDLDSLIKNAMNGALSYKDMLSYTTHEDVLTDVPGTQRLKTWFIQLGTAATFTDDWAEAAGTDDQYMNIGGKNASLFDVQTKLEAAFVEALSVSTTFVAASIPVNVFNRIQILDDFYIALFEANATARWNGNLKKLKLHDIDADGRPDKIIDAVGNEAFNNSDGRLKYEALTYWTEASALPPADPKANEVTERDGRAVNRGGAGQQIPGFINGTIGDVSSTITRQLYLEPVSGSAPVGFDATTANAKAWQSALGATSESEALAIIRWARGQDANDDDGDSNKAEARSWILGDAIHSRPLTINYGATAGYSEENPNIRLFMGTNDGIFHIFENTTVGGSESGKEVFGFIPREVLGNFKTLKDNTTAEHLYGIDGEPVALVQDDNANGTIDGQDKVYVYFGMRRGGRSIYALNASNPSANPGFMWKIDNTTSGFDNLGLTFSTPKVGKVRYSGKTVDVLIFAGGYDTSKDATATDEDGSRTPDTMGNAIYIVNARTGALIWKATYGATIGSAGNSLYTHNKMHFAIPSTVTTLDSNRNGITDRVYVGDLGGQVWRVDIPEDRADDDYHRKNTWQVSLLADLSDASDNTDVRFFHAPDIIQTKDSGGTAYDAVVVASGDRANPLESTDTNYLFMIKDKSIYSGAPSSTALDDAQLTDVTHCASPCAGLTFTDGWKMKMEGTGEKGLSSPLVSNGMVFFTSYIPYAQGGSNCEPREGSGKLYIMNLSDGAEPFGNARSIDIGPGIPASPIALSGDTILLPGTGLPTLPADSKMKASKNFAYPGGKSMWLLYWHESGVDL